MVEVVARAVSERPEGPDRSRSEEARGARRPRTARRWGAKVRVGPRYLEAPRSQRITFELTLRAEAGAVSPDCDDATAGAGRAYSACRSESGVERGVRPHSLLGHAEVE